MFSIIRRTIVGVWDSHAYPAKKIEIVLITIIFINNNQYNAAKRNNSLSL